MDGIIIIDKPKNYTSHDIVYKVKKIFKEKVGHTGTLDPMATGVLPLLIGKGTLVSKYLINHDKIYSVEMKLGIKTDTADTEGKVIEEKEVAKEILKKEKIEETLKTFLGEQEQLPPMYSAIKVKGKKLYEYARNGQTVELTPRKIEIYEISLKNIIEEENIIEFEVKCSKGTYIRSLCEDIGTRLGNIAYMTNLRRIEVGEFNISEAISFEELEEKNINELQDKVISLETLFKNQDKIDIDDKRYPLLLNGVKLTEIKQDGLYRLYLNNKFIGLGVIKNNLLKRDVIL